MLRTGQRKPSKSYPTLYVTVRVALLPAPSTAWTSKLCAPKLEVSIFAPFGTVPSHTATPEPPA